MHRRYYLLPLTAFACALSFGASAGLLLHGGTAQNVIRLSVPTLSNSTFTPSVPNGVVGTVSATVSDGSAITYSVGGTNSGGFQITGTSPPYTLVEGASGTACSTYSDFYIQASAPTAVNSPQLLYPTITPVSSCTTSANTIVSAVGFANSTSNNLQMSRSQNGTPPWTTVLPVPLTYTPPTTYCNPGCVRDPNVFHDQSGNQILYNGYYWLAHTDTNNTSASFALARTTDPNLQSWNYVQDVSCSNITGAASSTSFCWAPKFYQDGSGGMHAIVSACPGGSSCTFGGGPFSLYETHPTTSDPSGAWSPLVALGMTNPGTVLIDGAIIVRNGSATRYLLLRNATSNMLEMWTSATGDFSGYTLLRSLSELGVGIESPAMLLIGSSYYMYAFYYPNNTLFPLNSVGYATATSLNPANWTSASGVTNAGLGGSDATSFTWMPPNIVTALTMSCGNSCQFTSGTASVIGTPTPTFSSGAPSVTYQFQLSGIDNSGTTCVDYQTPGYLTINSSTGAISNTTTAPAQSYPGTCIKVTF